MSKRYDICTPRKGKDGKTFWTRIGTAFEGDKGIQLLFDALPLPDADGRCAANLFEPRERSEAQPQQQREQPISTYAGGAVVGASSDLDDDVPFITCDPSLEARVF